MAEWFQCHDPRVQISLWSPADSWCCSGFMSGSAPPSSLQIDNVAAESIGNFQSL